MSAVPPLIPGSKVYSTLEVDTAKVNTLIGNVLYKLNSWKGTVDVATVGSNVALVGLYAIDGFTLIKGSRVLVRNQTDPIQNGIYVANLLAWKRSGDLPIGSNASGVAVFAVNGTVNFDRIFVCITTKTADVVGTDPLVFSELLASSSSVGTINKIQVSGGVDLQTVASLATAAVDGTIATPSSVTTGTFITATTGDITATAGNMVALGHVYSVKTNFTQITNATTSVPITSAAGTITSVALTNAAGAGTTYTVTGSATLLPVGALMMVNISSYTGTGIPWVLVVPVASAGIATVTVRNLDAAVALNSTLTYKYMII